MFELLRSFTTVLDEFGVSHGRAKQAALCAAEGLMMVSTYLSAISIHYSLFTRKSGAEIKANTSANAMEIVSSIQAYVDTVAEPKSLVQPTVKLFPTNDLIETADEVRTTSTQCLSYLINVQLPTDH